MSMCNVQLSCQELRDIMAWEVAATYAGEIQNLEKRIGDMKVKRQAAIHGSI